MHDLMPQFESEMGHELAHELWMRYLQLNCHLAAEHRRLRRPAQRDLLEPVEALRLGAALGSIKI